MQVGIPRGPGVPSQVLLQGWERTAQLGWWGVSFRCPLGMGCPRGWMWEGLRVLSTSEPHAARRTRPFLQVEPLLPRGPGLRLTLASEGREGGSDGCRSSCGRTLALPCRAVRQALGPEEAALEACRPCRRASKPGSPGLATEANSFTWGEEGIIPNS